MSDINNLAGRIDAEFSAVADKVSKQQSAYQEEQKQRQKRIEHLGKLFEELQPVTKPRLELLAKKFGDKAKVTPRISTSSREAIFEFQSRQSRVTLKLAAFTDASVSKFVLTYDLQITPMLMRFTPHAEVEFPLDSVDKEKAAKWLDDRIIDFIKTYFAMGENELYVEAGAKQK
jgi:hypothetical protein